MLKAVEIADNPDDVNSDSQKSSTVTSAPLPELTQAELYYQAMASFNDIVLLSEPTDLS